jgi:hypothetical protein
MSSLFTILGEIFNPTPTQTRDQSFRQFKCFPAQVLDVCYDENSSLYKSPSDIGKIKFRDLIHDWNKPEKDLQKTALPLDRSFARYPLPGEQVIVFRAYGEIKEPALAMLANQYYYSFVVASTNNVTYNTNPFIGTNRSNIDPPNVMPLDEAKKRFEKKIKNKDAVKDGGDSVKVYKQLKPSEGDFILQGRFGQSIRLGSTTLGDESKGLPGDGIMKIRVERDVTTSENDMMTEEDIDKDDSSIYLCTGQSVDMVLSCSPNLKTWKTRYNLSEQELTAADRLRRSASASKLYKPVDTTIPIDQAYKTTTQAAEGQD